MLYQLVFFKQQPKTPLKPCMLLPQFANCFTIYRLNKVSKLASTHHVFICVTWSQFSNICIAGVVCSIRSVQDINLWKISAIYAIVCISSGLNIEPYLRSNKEHDCLLVKTLNTQHKNSSVLSSQILPVTIAATEVAVGQNVIWFMLCLHVIWFMLY